ncbi:DNA-binding protein [Gallaecimonas kandeliae]|uniref:DNA-binding protein n=1 Tax=Gallaecimonas kandeliae TaxID=3029055 RepID=UPI00264715DE|nr:DNA-binding protein [Gallaecimonas kandeliae]WKE67402.1 DNA-binding protein [Gallaecimonas kandeliae]
MPNNPFGQQLRANRDNVWKAAQALVEQGSQPSVNNVRNWLGGGSNSSISRYLQEWHGSSQEERSVRLATPLHLQQSLDALFQQLEQEKQDAIAAAGQGVQDSLAALAAERDQALAAEAEAKGQLAALQARLSDSQNAQAQSQEALEHQQKLLAETQRQLALAKQQSSQWQREAEDNRAQVSHLFHQQQHFQERWQALSAKEREEHEQARRQWQQEQSQLQAQLQILQSELGQKDRQMQGQQATPAGQLGERLEQQQQLLEKLVVEVDFLADQVRKRQQLKVELEALKNALGNS